MKKQIHFNKPQLRSIIIGAPMEVLVGGRALGKTTKLLAPKSANLYMGTMARSTGLNLNATYTQAYTRTLKELIRGWQSIGYQMDQHFVVCKRPSEKWIKQWRWKGPFAPPIEYKHFVSWWNGAVMQLISQDRPGSTNGVSIDWMIGDEIKLLSYEKLVTETFPANRGFIPEFANNPYHHGFTFTTDMPVGNAGRWILDYAEKMDRKKLDEFLQYVQIKHILQSKIKKAKGRDRYKLEQQLSVLLEEMNELRRGLLLYHEASTLENIHALGIEYIEQQLRDTPIFKFETQILNLRPQRLEDGFYPDFDEEYHGYFAEDPYYFDRSEIDPTNPVLDCRKDTDLNTDKPLHIALDFNRRINPISVVQKYPDEIRTLNCVSELYPKKLKDVLKTFIAYYKFHKRKTVYFWYDHTAIGEQHETSLKEDVVKALRKADWVVLEMYIGNTGVVGTHNERYHMWGSLLTEDGTYQEKFRINRENCNKLVLSINQAGAEQKGNGFGKNKKPEQDPNFPADEATHSTEAEDIVVWGLLHSGLKYSDTPSSTGGMMMG
jgi:hypothetical protein